MTAQRGLIILFSAIAVFFSIVAAINYTMDPQCYYKCPLIDVNKRTLNTYYQVAQRILAHPDAEVVILGSSRGETTPPLWIQEVAGLKTLNLSAAGAEVTTKLAFLKIAEENTKLKKVIWLADYFELVGATQDAKIKNTPALRHFLGSNSAGFDLSSIGHGLQGLLDHNNFEASIHFMKHRDQTPITQGAGSDMDYKACQSPDFKGKGTPASLRKEVDLLYQSYVHGVISPEQSPSAWDEFSKELTLAAQDGIEVNVVIIPYHPDFLARLKAEQPKIYERHQKWREKLLGLKTAGIHVDDNFDGIEDVDASFVNWNDGVHFNCRAAVKMLSGLVSKWK